MLSVDRYYRQCSHFRLTTDNRTPRKRTTDHEPLTMKPAIKKLRTCTYSRDLVTSAAAFGQRDQHTNKLVCDHPQMKLNWNEKVCGPCTAYENRNAELVVPVPQPAQLAPEPAKTAVPAAPKPPSPPAVTAPSPPVSPAPPAQSQAPGKTAPKPAGKPATPEMASVARPAKAAAKVKSPAKGSYASADTKAKSPAKPKAATEQPERAAKKTATKPKQK